MIELRSTSDRRALETWSLVLAAAGIPHHVARARGGWTLLVDRALEDRSRHELQGYESENVERSGIEASAPVYGQTAAGFAWAAGLALCFALTGPYDPRSAFGAGAADAAAILDGELWRSITALTLHADVAHLASNVAATALFATGLFYVLGPGLGAGLMVASGAAGNLANAWLRGPGHISVGMSTAVFGAIGVLCGLQAARHWRARRLRGGAWLPLAAGLGLLAMLGTAGERTDLSAHLLGLACGTALGAATGFTLTRPPGSRVQWLLSIASLAALAASWALTLRTPT